jgi:TctA family transporter
LSFFRQIVAARQHRFDQFGARLDQRGIGRHRLTQGVFGLGEIIANLETEHERSSAITTVSGLLPSREDWRRIIGPIMRGTALGSVRGATWWGFFTT